MPKLYSKKIVDIWEGEYRVFFNFFHQREKITFGFPKKGTRISDVYFKIDDEEQPRISIGEAKSYLTMGMRQILSPMVKGLESSHPHAKSIGYKYPQGRQNKYTKKTITKSMQGYCSNCQKKLRGDITKKLCFECWKNSGRSY